ncbi:MAG TPA: prepilin-type N-terminal cleavage/methylation domain-containing protein, partial [Opitutales bacterium]|nr:prepilin-type N-terminal cleavage/methylation domain-containing protein [Opitutales bacterium]
MTQPMTPFSLSPQEFRNISINGRAGKNLIAFESKRSSGGLTLIELLAVIAVIGILAAILIPITARARDSAKVAACQSNLRELGKAVFLFA